MKLSTSIGRIAGIDLRVHVTFWLLLGFAALVPLLAGRGLAAALGTTIFVLALFGIVVLHELGHALAARRYGIGTRDITLLPIGGVAHLERLPERPGQEIVVALAGPAVNLALAAVLFVALLVVGAAPWAGLATLGAESFVSRLFWANLLIFGFNLIPAFPMDGGRVLRALLALRLTRVRATWIAARVGQALAVVFGLVGLVGNPLLVLIALFIWFGAEEEARATEVNSLLRDVPVTELMVSEVRTLSPEDTVGAVAVTAGASFQRDYPVLAHGYLVGMVSRTELLVALHEGRAAAPVAAVMRHAPPAVDADEPVRAALERLGDGEATALAVTSEGRFVGLLPVERLGEHVAVRAAEAARAAGDPTRTRARGARDPMSTEVA